MKAGSGDDARFRFTAPIKRARLGFGYRIGLLSAAIVMLALPVIYVMMIAAVAYLVYLHIIYDGQIFHYVRGGRVALFFAILYLAPIVAGAILILFMIKPLFARQKKTGITLSLDR